ncbi:glutaredoxin domain-containing protein [Rhodospirillum sp. A1_3_36]|uniref:glutaredoxin domain-containing protein n=1 Tax=Rhodospirillum sp. A1_3_36 TaxID=3391666 RepID=UPI0039A65638
MAIEIYTKTNCIFCQKAKAWFTEHSLPYEENDVSDVASFSAMQERIPGAKTVPQILIDGNLIGGYDTLMQYEQPILEKLKKTYG